MAAALISSAQRARLSGFRCHELAISYALWSGTEEQKKWRRLEVEGQVDGADAQPR